jgi:hypothetical protein
MAAFGSLNCVKVPLGGSATSLERGDKGNQWPGMNGFKHSASATTIGTS